MCNLPAKVQKNFIPCKHRKKKLYWNIGYWIHFFFSAERKNIKICIIFYIIY